MTKPDYDKTYERPTVPARCAVCNQCRLFSDKDGQPLYPFRCVQGGPYVGYVEEKDYD